ncbi:UNVERIFIED_CONTAM: hypothetical protein Sindi_2266800 [Sesamum indicum]
MPEYYNWTSHGVERVQEYFKAVTTAPLWEEQTLVSHVMLRTSTPWGDAAHMNWAQRIVFYAVGPVVWFSNYSQDGVLDDGTRSCLTDAGPSLYYGEGPYDYVFGLANRFHDIVHATE